MEYAQETDLTPLPWKFRVWEMFYLCLPEKIYRGVKCAGVLLP